MRDGIDHLQFGKLVGNQAQGPALLIVGRLRAGNPSDLRLCLAIDDFFRFRSKISCIKSRKMLIIHRNPQPLRLKAKRSDEFLLKS